MASQTNDHLLNTILGTGSIFFGDLELTGMVRIDGSVVGSIKTSGKVVIGGNARCECSIRAKSAVIGGIVKGDIIVDESLVLLEGSSVIGNIYAPKFETEEGVFIHGDCKFSGKFNMQDELTAFVHEHGGIRESPKVKLDKKTKGQPFLSAPDRN